MAGQSQGGGFRQPQNTGLGGGLAGQGQGGRGKELVASFQGQGGGFRQQSQGFPRKQQSFNNPQINQGFNSFNQPGFRGSFSPTQSNFGNNGFGRSFGNLPQAQTPGGFGSEVGGRVKGNPNLEVETFQPGNVSGFSSYLAIFFHHRHLHLHRSLRSLVQEHAMSPRQMESRGLAPMRWPS